MIMLWIWLGLLEKAKPLGLEYCFRAWGTAAQTTLALLDSFQKSAITLIASVENGYHCRCDVADLEILYRYFHWSGRQIFTVPFKLLKSME